MKCVLELVLYVLVVCQCISMFKCIEYYRAAADRKFNSRFAYGRQAPDPCPQPQPIENGRIRLTLRRTTVRYACTRDFELFGTKTSRCSGGAWSSEPPVCVRNGCPKLKPIKNGDGRYIMDNSVVLFNCIPGYNIVGSSAIYCDGNSWNDTKPTCVQNSNSTTELNCDFEKDLCGWTQGDAQDLDWRRHLRATPSSMYDTGPVNDHTLGPGKDGHYMYIESTGVLPYSKALLISPIYEKTADFKGCFSFYYHMFGRRLGNLRVYQAEVKEDIEAGSPTGDAVLLFEKNDNQGKHWHRGAIKLESNITRFQIMIEATRGMSHLSDIAIDDVELLTSEEACQEALAEANRPIDDTINILSCRKRCNSKDDFTPSGFRVLCTCDDACLDQLNCCYDYFDACLFETTTDSENQSDSAEPPPQTAKLVNASVNHDEVEPPVRKVTKTNIVTTKTQPPTTLETTTIAELNDMIEPSNKKSSISYSSETSEASTSTTVVTRTTKKKTTTMGSTRGTSTKKKTVDVTVHSKVSESKPPSSTTGYVILGFVCLLIGCLIVVSYVGFKRTSRNRSPFSGLIRSDSQAVFLTENEVVSFE